MDLIDLCPSILPTVSSGIKAQLFARITVEGKRAEIATHREVSPLEWDSRAQMVVGKSQEAKEINNHLAIAKKGLRKLIVL